MAAAPPESVDVLMITHNRPAYARLSLERLLATADERVRVWIWHNGTDVETLDVARSFASHPRVHCVHHSEVNRRLTEPTNWLWSEATGTYLSKVDDDCLVPEDWIERLSRMHRDVPELGAVGCWRFPPEDFVPDVAERKIRTLAGGHRVLVNCWVEGSGYLMKRACVETQGLLREGESFSRYCIRLALAGWIHGWAYPFLSQEHMDDPRAPHSLLRTDEDLLRYLPLSARANGITTLDAWTAQLRRSARLVQEASPDPRDHVGWRARVRRLRGRLGRIVGMRGQW